MAMEGVLNLGFSSKRLHVRRLAGAYRERFRLVRADGIEPTRPAWKAGVLPLNYARVAQERRDSPSRPFGQARKPFLRQSPKGCAISFSPGFYPVPHCGRPDCAVVWLVWHSFLQRQRPRFIRFARYPRKRPRT